MNRRTVLKNLFWVVGMTTLYPSCIQKKSGTNTVLRHISLSEEDAHLMGEISETLIPKTDTPGALDLKIPDFVLKMLDDAYSKKDQVLIQKGLLEFNSLCKKQYSKNFQDLEQKQKLDFLKHIEIRIKGEEDGRKKSTDPENLQPMVFFYKAIKNQTLFGYTSSEYFMTKQRGYEMVPGRYLVHVPIHSKI